MKSGGFYFLLIAVFISAAMYFYQEGDIPFFRAKAPALPAPVIIGGGMVKIEVLRTGAGRTARSGSVVKAAYTAKFQDGSVFELVKADRPELLALGTGDLIRGLDEGLRGVQPGEIRRLTIAPDYAFGRSGNPVMGIPANVVVIYEIEVLGIQ
jgi:FKBP-type peptidyl-prolyl cis-trans isomerase